MPSAFGVFLRALAQRSGETTTVFAHRIDEPTGIEDMELGPPTVRWVDLGPRRSAPQRLFSPGQELKRLREELADVDVLVIHGPTPLLPRLVAAARPRPAVLLIWGDYGGWRPQQRFSTLRNIGIGAFMRVYARQQRRAAKGLLAFINNPDLAPTIDGADIKMVTFSTVTQADLAENTTSPQWSSTKGRDEPVRLIYAGRIVRDKGVLEAVRTVKLLKDRGYAATLELLGWAEKGDPIEEQITALAAELCVASSVSLGGYVPAGPELLDRYRQADVFILPTFWDSLPRAMLEAMAVGLPVVTTSVGGIAHFFTDRENLLFADPHRVDTIADAIEALITDPALRTRVADGGRAWSRQHSVEADCETIIGEIEHTLHKQSAGR